jgi:hypothetical protein
MLWADNASQVRAASIGTALMDQHRWKEGEWNEAIVCDVIIILGQRHDTKLTFDRCHEILNCNTELLRLSASLAT